MKPLVCLLIISTYHMTTQRYMVLYNKFCCCVHHLFGSTNIQICHFTSQQRIACEICNKKTLLIWSWSLISLQSKQTITYVMRVVSVFVLPEVAVIRVKRLRLKRGTQSWNATLTKSSNISHDEVCSRPYPEFTTDRSEQGDGESEPSNLRIHLKNYNSLQMFELCTSCRRPGGEEEEIILRRCSSR